jgi:voltage-gated potassium channel Kch
VDYRKALKVDIKSVYHSSTPPFVIRSPLTLAKTLNSLARQIGTASTRNLTDEILAAAIRIDIAFEATRNIYNLGRAESTWSLASTILVCGTGVVSDVAENRAAAICCGFGLNGNVRDHRGNEEKDS